MIIFVVCLVNGFLVVYFCLGFVILFLLFGFVGVVVFEVICLL